MNRITRNVLVWVYSALAAALGGIGTAVSAAVGGQVVGAMNFTPRQLAVVALSGAVCAVAAYLKNSPLPRLGDEPQKEG